MSASMVVGALLLIALIAWVVAMGLFIQAVRRDTLALMNRFLRDDLAEAQRVSERAHAHLEREQ